MSKGHVLRLVVVDDEPIEIEERDVLDLEDDPPPFTRVMRWLPPQGLETEPALTRAILALKRGRR